ncbi:bifunctional folylpolyglutamate synthase/dihydrofolate synthase [Pseudoneobacillus rhizosphaerae]|uniref:tetrahydrofolate synthase n=1 Tax=Pseudoneobacillus rhizosphaerae TaxID=2880968 RepID=A0A9C7GAT9_9BACI|nr:folylpolyglutamate synthase/dihydrofolate synthase family protein [Pseudoneobacillus rhizosphaerae]CAG9608800.1 Folylpolyglutamate synthase [Pseudoneobacillus rhizosphaerae]
MIKGFHFYKSKFDIQTNEEINLGLDRIQEILASIGNPQNEIKTVHIAGTNGKGSTLQFLRTILMEAGYLVGSFTSPHILSVNDQISTNDGPISIEKFEETIRYLIKIVEDKKKIELLTDFELLTVLSIVYFSRINKQDIILFETGMGGLQDSTNIIQPLVSIITNISLEHTAFLGNNLSDIAVQKAGIIKDHIPCVTAVKNIEALDVIKKYANEHHSSLYVLNEDFAITSEGKDFTLHSPKTKYDLELHMKGQHQKENCSLAIVAAELLNKEHSFTIEHSHVENGVKNAFWPGRFERVSVRPDIILDGAHNDDAVQYLVKTLKDEYPGHNFQFLFGALKDKNSLAMIRMLEEIADKITFVDFDFPRAASAEQLEALSILENKSSASHLSDCLSTEIKGLNEDDILVITGSLYLISEVKDILKDIL